MIRWLAAFGLAAGMASAEAPEVSLTPELRPDPARDAMMRVRPQARPGPQAGQAAALATVRAEGDPPAAPEDDTAGGTVAGAEASPDPAVEAIAAALPPALGAAGRDAPVADGGPEIASRSSFSPGAGIAEPGAFVANPAPGDVRPILRDDRAFGERAFQRSVILYRATGLAVRDSLRPSDRPAAIEAMARRIERERLAGAVCGDPAIQGDVLGNVPGRGRCGIENGVRVRSVAGVRLSTPATLDCPTARALRRWVEDGVRPAVGDLGGGASSLRVIAHYACRGRNNQSGARLSEHSFGRAIDIAGIGLRDGSELSVLRDWGGGRRGRALRQMHSAACGPFGTVLGPNANRFHRDHFHLDTARYRSGSYCR